MAPGGPQGRTWQRAYPVGISGNLSQLLNVSSQQCTPPERRGVMIKFLIIYILIYKIFNIQSTRDQVKENFCDLRMLLMPTVFFCFFS